VNLSIQGFEVTRWSESLGEQPLGMES